MQKTKVNQLYNISISCTTDIKDILHICVKEQFCVLVDSKNRTGCGNFNCDTEPISTVFYGKCESHQKLVIII